MVKGDCLHVGATRSRRLLEPDFVDGELKWTGSAAGRKENAVDVVTVCANGRERNRDFLPFCCDGQVLDGGVVPAGFCENHQAVGTAVTANPEMNRVFGRKVNGNHGRRTGREKPARPCEGEGIGDSSGNLQGALAAFGAACDPF